MSKYRLCYKENKKYIDIDLDKLYCLRDYDVTDIKTIDDFTMKFDSEEDLLKYLKTNNLIQDNVDKLYITIDKKDKKSGLTYNGKLFRSEYLLFKEDIRKFNILYIHNLLLYKRNDKEFFIKLCNNYMEKYQNSVNKETKTSTILGIFRHLKNYALNTDFKDTEEIDNFHESIKDFINIEFYKINKDLFLKEHKIERKKDKDGSFLRNYRNIHDFVTFMKELDLNLSYKENLNVATVKDDELEEDDEFLTEDDRKYMKVYMDDSDCFQSYRDGNDYIKYITQEEYEEDLDSMIKKLSLKNSKGDY